MSPYSILSITLALAIPQEHAAKDGQWVIVYEADEKLQSVCPKSREEKLLARVPKLALDHYRRSTLSPDGKIWACVTTQDGDAEIWTCDQEGGDPIRITNNSDIDNMPSWNSNGRCFLFGSTQTGKWQIWIASADGKDTRKLTDCLNGAWEPRCNPKNDTFAYLEFIAPTPEGGMNLVISKPDGKADRVLLKETSMREYAWSPDGGSIAYSVPGEIIVIDSETGKEKDKITLGEINPAIAGEVARFPIWRPDQIAIAASLQVGSKANPDPNWNGILLWSKGGRAQVLPTAGRARVHNWQLRK